MDIKSSQIDCKIILNTCAKKHEIHVHWRNFMKKLLSVILCSLLVLSALPFTAAAEAADDAGSAVLSGNPAGIKDVSAGLDFAVDIEVFDLSGFCYYSEKAGSG